MKSCILIGFLACLAALLAIQSANAALPPDVMQRLPSPERVQLDFPDDAEGYVALNALYRFLQPHASSSMMDPTGLKAAAFYNAGLAVDATVRNGATSAAAYNAFSERVQKLTADPRFKEKVLAKYRLAGGSAARQAAPTREEDELQSAIRGSIPWWIAAGIAMVVMAPIFVLLLDRRSLPLLPTTDAAMLPLPDALRQVEVIGRRYSVHWQGGLVVDKETTIEHRLHVTAIVDHGNPVNPPRIETARETTRTDCLWVLLPDGRERAWNFTNAAIQARPSHLVSALGRTLRNGTTEFLIAYNHSTGQSGVLAGLSNANRPRRLLAWLATTACGALAICLVFGSMVFGGGVPLNSQYLFHVGTWTYPVVMAGVLALVLIPIAASVIGAMRDARFKRRFLPAYVRVFADSKLKEQFRQA